MRISSAGGGAQWPQIQRVEGDKSARSGVNSGTSRPADTASSDSPDSSPPPQSRLAPTAAGLFASVPRTPSASLELAAVASREQHGFTLLDLEHVRRMFKGGPRSLDGVEQILQDRAAAALVAAYAYLHRPYFEYLREALQTSEENGGVASVSAGGFQGGGFGQGRGNSGSQQQQREQQARNDAVEGLFTIKDGTIVRRYGDQFLPSDLARSLSRISPARAEALFGEASQGFHSLQANSAVHIGLELIRTIRP